MPKDRYLATQQPSSAGNFNINRDVFCFMIVTEKIHLPCKRSRHSHCFVCRIGNKNTAEATAKHSDTESDEEEEEEEKPQAAPEKKKYDPQM